MGRIANALGSRQIYPRMLGMSLVLALGVIGYDVVALQASHRRASIRPASLATTPPTP